MDVNIKAHMGLLREDLLLLRDTFGLHLGRSRSRAQGNFGSINNEFSQAQNLPASNLKDLLVLSVDIIGHPTQLTKENGQYQIGLSIFDTRHLQPLTHQPRLQSHHFCIGSEKFFEKSSRTFCFGESRYVTLAQAQHEIHGLVSNRNTILVVYGGNQDLFFLEAAQIHIHPLCVIDIQKAAQGPLDLESRHNLAGILTLLNCPFNVDMLDKPGNHSNLQLRALLLLAVVDATNHSNASPQLDLEPDIIALLSTFQDTARKGVPLEMFKLAVESALRKDHNCAQNRRARKNARQKEEKAAKRGKQAIPELSGFSQLALDHLVAAHGLEKLSRYPGNTTGMILGESIGGIGTITVESLPRVSRASKVLGIDSQKDEPGEGLGHVCRSVSNIGG